MSSLVDPYVYPDTNILKNKFNVQSQKTLDELEADYTSVRLAELISDESLSDPFDFDRLCEIHSYIFQDIFDWASVPRTIQIVKNEDILGGISIEYSEPDRIIADAEKVLDKNNKLKWNELSKNDLVFELEGTYIKFLQAHIKSRRRTEKGGASLHHRPNKSPSPWGFCLSLQKILDFADLIIIKR